jgi:hypothetical protein
MNTRNRINATAAELVSHNICGQTDNGLEKPP